MALSRLYPSALWALLGNLAPMLAALLAVPFLLLHLGQERLGVLSLVWIVVGYFSFLDMGLGRAVTVSVAACRARASAGHDDELHVLGTACIVLGGVGGATALLLGGFIAGWGVPVRLSSVPMQQEVTLALLWMLPSLPLLLLSSALRGHLEGAGAFRSLNLLRIPTGVLLAVGPCLTALYDPSLVWACASILLVRLVHVVALLWLVARDIRVDFSAVAGRLLRAGSRLWLRRLLSFGGWLTVSGVVGPVIVHLDRFVIGVLLSASAVALYALPFDVVSRLPVLVASLASVLLPELVRLSRGGVHGQGDIGAVRELLRQSSVFSAVLVLLVVALCWVLTPWALRVWLGPVFEAQSTQLTRVLLLAFGVNALAQIPFTALQAVGKVRAVALLHLAELLPYVIVLVWAIAQWGVVGAAWVWLLRGSLDYAALAWIWHRHAKLHRQDI